MIYVVKLIWSATSLSSLVYSSLINCSPQGRIIRLCETIRSLLYMGSLTVKAVWHINATIYVLCNSLHNQRTSNTFPSRGRRAQGTLTFARGKGVHMPQIPPPSFRRLCFKSLHLGGDVTDVFRPCKIIYNIEIPSFWTCHKIRSSRKISKFYLKTAS